MGLVWFCPSSLCSSFLAFSMSLSFLKLNLGLNLSSDEDEEEEDEEDDEDEDEEEEEEECFLGCFFGSGAVMSLRIESMICSDSVTSFFLSGTFLLSGPVCLAVNTVCFPAIMSSLSFFSMENMRKSRRLACFLSISFLFLMYSLLASESNSMVCNGGGGSTFSCFFSAIGFSTSSVERFSSEEEYL